MSTNAHLDDGQSEEEAPDMRALRARVAAWPGLKRRDITACQLCGKGVMHDRSITFVRITVESYMLDLGAVQRAHGLELVVGSPSIAAVMGPDEDLAKRYSEIGDVIVCDHCSIHGGSLAAITERQMRANGGGGQR